MSALESPKNVEKEIKREAYYLSKENLSYEDLCWMLAENRIHAKRKRKGRIAKAIIKEVSKGIFKESLKYDDHCWQIASIKVKSKIE